MCFLGLVQGAHLKATGHEGSIAGRLFALFAVAIFPRLGVTLSGGRLDAAASRRLAVHGSGDVDGSRADPLAQFSMRGN